VSLRFMFALLLASAASALAEVHYVDVNSTNATPPYTNWTTAATVIQDAVDAAAAGDEVVVTNGTYDTGLWGGNRVVVNKPLNVRSVNGPTVTTIDGSGQARCVVLFNGAGLSGFTITHGFVSAPWVPSNPSRGRAGVLCLVHSVPSVPVVKSLRMFTFRTDHFRPFFHKARLAFTTYLCALSVFLWQFSALADVHYVDASSTNATPPYTNWTTPATSIQDAVDAAVPG